MEFERLKRAHRNWRRKWQPVRPANLPEPFHHAPDIQAVHAFFSRPETDQAAIPDTTTRVSGVCYVCSETVNFEVDPPGPDGAVNWRETLACPNCRLINRWRSCIHLFEAICQPMERDRIYLTETLSPVYATLATRYPFLVGSEYVPGAEPGGMVKLHHVKVRNEDVTRLSFDDRSLEAVLCFDVLEHVPDYRAALREFCRVLAPGGQVVLSVPFSFRQQTVVRAEVDSDGVVRHLQPPCFHGDPLSAQGVLSYYDFGMELLGEMQQAGFSECFLVCYRSSHWGYPNDNVAFVARKVRRWSLARA